MRQFICRTALISTLLVVQAFGSNILAHAEETKPVFEFDCINFAGRNLGNAPLKKKKPHPGLAVDGTVWTMSPETKRVTITQIIPGEAAEKAGLAVGDEIITVNNYPTEGANMRGLVCAYHMYKLDSLIETLVVRKKDGTEQTLKLQLLPVDKCNPEEKTAWLDLFKGLGY